MIINCKNIRSRAQKIDTIPWYTISVRRLAAIGTTSAETLSYIFMHSGLIGFCGRQIASSKGQSGFEFRIWGRGITWHLDCGTSAPQLTALKS